MMGISLRDVSDSEAVNLGYEMMTMLENHYCERMARAIVIAPPIFGTLWSMFRGLVDPATAEKIRIVSPRKLLPVLREIMDDDVIQTSEQQALAQLVGEERAGKAIEFAKTQGGDAVEEKLEEAVARINTASVAISRRFYETLRTFSLSLDVTFENTRMGSCIHQLLRLR